MQKSSETLKKRGFRIARGGVLSCILAAVMTMYLPAMALAEPYDLNTGSITVNSDASGNRTVSQDNGVQNHPEEHETVITSNNTATNHTVTINSSGTGDNAAKVTLQNVNIRTDSDTPVSTSGSGDVIIELNGTNKLHGGQNNAGLEKSNTGNLMLQDADNTAGSLNACGNNGAAGIGGGAGRDRRDVSNITITGGTIIAEGGTGAAGIGGGDGGAGSNITITGGTVIAAGLMGGAGIGGGDGGAGSNITISGPARVSVAGGDGAAAIGNGGGQAQGTPVIPDTSGLYNTGGIVTYEPGTSALQIERGYIDPVEEKVGELPDPTVNPGPQPQQRAAVAAIAAADDSYAPATAATAEDVDAAFYAAVDMQVEELLKEINALIAEGKLNEANALIAKGLKINAGTHKGFNASTLAKLGEASRMGIAVTVNFVYAGTSYSVTILGHSVIDPVSLVDQNGYCGFLNLVKYFG